MAATIKSLPGEIWKPVVGWDGYYEISDHGRLRSVERIVYRPSGVAVRWKGRLLKMAVTVGGHYIAVLCRKSIRRMVRVHRLVLEAFVGPCPAGMECCHGNGNPADNRLGNLRWDTSEANKADQKRHGTALLGERNPHSRMTQAQVEFAREHYSFRDPEYNCVAMAKRFGVSKSTVHAAIAERSWKFSRHSEVMFSKFPFPKG